MYISIPTHVLEKTMFPAELELGTNCVGPYRDRDWKWKDNAGNKFPRGEEIDGIESEREPAKLPGDDFM